MHDHYEKTADHIRFMSQMSQPLVSADFCAETHQRVETWFHSDTEWESIYWAGVITSIAKTLPPNDPWTQPHQNFGTYRDGLDVCYHITSNLPADDDYAKKLASIDIRLMSLYEPLAGESLDIYRAALSGFNATRAAINERRLNGGRTIKPTIQVMQWLLWRRRAYQGWDDALPIVVGRSWIRFASEIVGHMNIDRVIMCADLEIVDFILGENDYENIRVE